jgi:hypothetical protein
MNRPLVTMLALSLLGTAGGCGGTDSPATARSESAETRPGTTAEPFAETKEVRPGFLVTQEKPFTTAQVQAVRDLKGISEIALIGYKQLTMYDRLLATAAVDPATFRRFTYPDTANSRPLWTAVRDGAGLISHEAGARDHLPLAASMPVGPGTVRLAGLATTVPGIDLTVSVQKGRDLGVPFGNGAVVAVSGDPRRLRSLLGERFGSVALIRQIFDAPRATPDGSILPLLTPTSAPTSAPTRAPSGSTPPAG